VVRLVDAMVPLYPDLNRDLLVVGALLHDLGKVAELSYERAFEYTDEGRLIGHISIGVEMLTERIATVAGFPRELAMLLKHLLLSHHGQYDYGSPKRPKTVEATILHYLDDLDSKINGIRSHIAKETAQGNRWTSHHRLYNLYFFTGNGTEEEQELTALSEPLVEAAPELGKKSRRRSEPASAINRSKPCKVCSWVTTVSSRSTCRTTLSTPFPAAAVPVAEFPLPPVFLSTAAGPIPPAACP